MNIVNKERYISNKKLNLFINLLGPSYFPRNLIVFENRWQRLLYNIKNPAIVGDDDFFPPPRGIFDVTDQNYIPYTDTVEIFTYYHYGDSQISLEILKSLAYALRVRHYYYDYLKIMNVDLNDSYMMEDIEICKNRIQTPEYISMIEKYVDNLINVNSNEIQQILRPPKQDHTTKHVPV